MLYCFTVSKLIIFVVFPALIWVLETSLVKRVHLSHGQLSFRSHFLFVLHLLCIIKHAGRMEQLYGRPDKPPINAKDIHTAFINQSLPFRTKYLISSVLQGLTSSKAWHCTRVRRGLATTRMQNTFRTQDTFRTVSDSSEQGYYNKLKLIPYKKRNIFITWKKYFNLN